MKLKLKKRTIVLPPFLVAKSYIPLEDVPRSLVTTNKPNPYKPSPLNPILSNSSSNNQLIDKVALLMGAEYTDYAQKKIIERHDMFGMTEQEIKAETLKTLENQLNPQQTRLLKFSTQPIDSLDDILPSST